MSRLDTSIFSDLDLTLTPSPLTGDISPKVDHDAIKRTVRHLFQFNAYDIPFNSSIKCNIKNYLFETFNQLVIARMEEEINWAAAKLEPRIKISELDIKSDETSKGLNITVWYKIQSLNLEETFQFIVERAR